MWPLRRAPPSASTVKLTGFPTSIPASWVSLKLATIHTSSGTSEATRDPGVTYCPIWAEISLSFPSTGAVMRVCSRLIFARLTAAWAAWTAASRNRRWMATEWRSWRAVSA